MRAETGEKEVERFKGMLSQQLERVIDYGDETEEAGKLGMSSTDLLAKSGGGLGGGGLLRKLESEAGEMAGMAGIDKKEKEARKEVVVEEEHLGGGGGGFAETIDPKIINAVHAHPAQAVLIMNQEGLLRCFNLYSRNQHTGGVEKNKRKRGVGLGGGGGAGVRVLDEDNFLRVWRDLGLGSVLPHSKLLGECRGQREAKRASANQL